MDKTREAIIQLERERQERRVFAAESKKKKNAEARDLHERGKVGDSDFVSMIERFRDNFPVPSPARGDDIQQQIDNEAMFQNKINVAVRKRPTSEREVLMQDHDSVTCANPLVYVHACKLKVDGITKVLENTRFEFDFAFDEHALDEDIYQQTTLPLVRWAALDHGRSTVFAYGQTGSGKTFTMEGLQQRVARDLFQILDQSTLMVRVMCSNYELYGTQCLDLLNDQKVLPIREDEKNCVHIVGLREEEAQNEDELLAILQRGGSNRTTRATEMNSDSSRSHSIFQINLNFGRSSGGVGGTILLVDLAGSERGQDTKHHDATRRTESAAINTSLLSLKECIRALENGGSATQHVPYRQSKLTMVLKDSFSSSLKSKTLMIGCVSPAASSTDHTLNTLRYADRVKEKKAGRPTQQASATPSSRPVSTGRASLANARPSRISLGGNSAPRPNPPPQPTTTALPSRVSLLPASSRTQPTAARPTVKALPVQQPPLQSPAPVRAQRVVVETATATPVSRPLRPTPPSAAPSPVSSFSARLEQQQHEPPKSSVAALLDEEDALLLAYRDAVQENFHLLAEESNILTQLSEQVEYDVFASTEELRILLEHKLMLFGDLHQRLVKFQTNVRTNGDAAVQ